MRILRLYVNNIRSHGELTIELSPQTTVFAGKNGVGKTSLLEAIYIALQGVSFKGSDAEILRRDQPWYRIELLQQDSLRRSVTFDPSRQSGKKKFNINGKNSYRLSSKDKYPVVLFEPDDLRLLHGSPSCRRQFIDRFLAQIDPLYSTTIRKYERALKQRNSLLKREDISNEDLFIWNIALSEYGASIIEKRIYAIEMINKEISNYYNRVAGKSDEVNVHYSNTTIDSSAQKMLRDLESKLDYDKAVKHTSVGPHRHDILFSFNNSPALSVASRGEVRTILLALKQIEVDIINKLTARQPIILLDDVFSELDANRQVNIAELFKNSQIIISSATSHAENDFLHINLDDLTGV